MKRVLIMALALALCLSAVSVPAMQLETEASTPSITLYADNRPDWESAVGVFEEECFTDATLNPGVSVVSEYPGYIDTAKGVWWDRLVCPADGMTTTTWHFATPIIGFGADWDPGVPGGPGANIAVAINGGWVAVGEVPATYTGQFWGFVSSEPFQAVRLSPGSRCDVAWCETYEMDNMVYAPLGIKIIEPNGGESWAIGSKQIIAWISAGAISSVDVSLSRDGGTSWQTIASGVANDGNLTWQVTGPATSQALVRVASSSEADTYDISDASFSIVPRPSQHSPTITSFKPEWGYSGTQVSIVGTNFVKGGTEVVFGRIKANPSDITWQSSTQIKVRVPNAPEAAITGKITVKTSQGTAQSVGSFEARAPSQPWGAQIGIYNGVAAYSNGAWWTLRYNDQGIAERSDYGYAYQCVEYINRYYVLALGHKNMIGTGNAESYYNNVSNKGLDRFANGGVHPPKVHDILVFYDSKNIYGHVAIVTNLVTDNKGNLTAIDIIQQNVVSPFQPNAKYRATARLSVQTKEQGGKTTYHVSNVGSGLNTAVVGWSRIPENP